jgi:uncharacterized tellurite resistance protein B-like protein
MLDSLRAFFERHPASSGEADDERLKVAACALLLEMAYADGTFSDTERTHVERALVESFALPEDRVQALIATAEKERREAIDLHQFTSVLVRHYDEGQRYVLAELLWRIVLADGQVSRDEDMLLHKLGRLLDVRPGYLAGIRKKLDG